ncbi:MAG: hypothetical protein ACREJC_20840 [Tepidisphaeraceae bacterium]
MGEALGTGGYLLALRRVRIGPWCDTDAVALGHLDVTTVGAHLREWPAVLRKPERPV